MPTLQWSGSWRQANLFGNLSLLLLTCEQAQAEVTTIAQADRTLYRLVELHLYGEADVYRKGRSPPARANEMTYTQRLQRVEASYHSGGWPVARRELRGDLAFE